MITTLHPIVAKERIDDLVREASRRRRSRTPRGLRLHARSMQRRAGAAAGATA